MKIHNHEQFVQFESSLLCLCLNRFWDFSFLATRTAINIPEQNTYGFVRVLLFLGGRLWVQFRRWSIRFGCKVYTVNDHFRWTYLWRDPPRCKYGFPSSSLFFEKHRRMKIMHIKLTIDITIFILFKRNWSAQVET